MHLMLTIQVPMYNAMKKVPGVPVPKDGAGGKHGLFWYAPYLRNVF